MQRAENALINIYELPLSCVIEFRKLRVAGRRGIVSQKQSRPACEPRRSLLVLVRALNPHEGLHVYHIPRAKVTLVAPDCFGELKKAGVCVPRRPRLVAGLKPVLARGCARDRRLEEDVCVRLRDESEDGHERPCQHARLPSRKPGDRLDPTPEPSLDAACAVQEFVKPLGERARARLRLYGVAQRHLLEREDHAVARTLLDAHGARGYLGELARAQEPPELRARERLLPAPVRLPLVASLPLDVSLVPEPAGEEPQKLPPTPLRPRQ